MVYRAWDGMGTECLVWVEPAERHNARSVCAMVMAIPYSLTQCERIHFPSSRQVAEAKDNTYGG